MIQYTRVVILVKGDVKYFSKALEPIIQSCHLVNWKWSYPMFYYSILVLLAAVGLYMVYWVLDTLSPPPQYYELSSRVHKVLQRE